MADSLISGVLSTPGLTTGASTPTQKTKDAAVQFESLLVGQILKSAHEEEGGWLGAGEEDQAAGAAMQMADEYFARALSSHGGLGLAKMISTSLDQATATANANTNTNAGAKAASRSNPATK
jgi:Rod binding domain-containing protein